MKNQFKAVFEYQCTTNLQFILQEISDESDEEKLEKKHQIQTLYAFDLFANKFFKDSMKEFSKLETDPCDVIRLFPDLLPQDGPMSTSTSKSSPTSAAATKTTSLPKLVDKDLEMGLLALIDYLTEVRYNLQKELHTSESKSYSSNTNRLLSIIDTTLLKCYLQVSFSGDMKFCGTVMYLDWLAILGYACYPVTLIGYSVVLIQDIQRMGPILK